MSSRLVGAANSQNSFDETKNMGCWLVPARPAGVEHAAPWPRLREDAVHLSRCQLEVEDGDILGDALGIGGLRNGADTLLLHVPAQRDLGRRPAVLLGDSRH